MTLQGSSTQIAIATIAEMLTYCRPHGGQSERAFIRRYIEPFGAQRDAYGNYHLTIGSAPIIWSCHTDTVSHHDGRQRVKVDSRGILSLTDYSAFKHNCLGADDTIGVYLLCEMIKAGISGRYIFHYGEECGCIGSNKIARYKEALLGKYQAAIAFDRRGTRDIITHQMMSRTCSDVFAYALADQLNASSGLKYEPSEYGSYTDTAQYAEVVPECTNVSIGYSSEHSRRESVDTNHVIALCHALRGIDTSALPIARKPEPDSWGYVDDSAYDSSWKYRDLRDNNRTWTTDDRWDYTHDRVARGAYLNSEYADVQHAIDRDYRTPRWFGYKTSYGWRWFDQTEPNSGELSTHTEQRKHKRSRRYE